MGIEELLSAYSRCWRWPGLTRIRTPVVSVGRPRFDVDPLRQVEGTGRYRVEFSSCSRPWRSSC